VNIGLVFHKFFMMSQKTHTNRTNWCKDVTANRYRIFFFCY